MDWADRPDVMASFPSPRGCLRVAIEDLGSQHDDGVDGSPHVLRQRNDEAVVVRHRLQELRGVEETSVEGDEGLGELDGRARPEHMQEGPRGLLLAGGDAPGLGGDRAAPGRVVRGSLIVWRTTQPQQTAWTRRIASVAGHPS